MNAIKPAENTSRMSDKHLAAFDMQIYRNTCNWLHGRRYHTETRTHIGCTTYTPIPIQNVGYFVIARADKIPVLMEKFLLSAHDSQQHIHTSGHSHTDWMSAMNQSIFSILWAGLVPFGHLKWMGETCLCLHVFSVFQKMHFIVENDFHAPFHTYPLSFGPIQRYTHKYTQSNLPLSFTKYLPTATHITTNTRTVLCCSAAIKERRRYEISCTRIYVLSVHRARKKHKYEKKRKKYKQTLWIRM